MASDGGPAFPIGSGDMRAPVGMSLRDWFASQASEADIEAYMRYEIAGAGVFSRTRELARYAYADAMLRAREVPHKYPEHTGNKTGSGEEEAL